MELATLENTLLAFPPMRRTVPITNTRMTASMTAYSAMSCPCSSLQRLRRYSTIDPPGGSGVANNADSDGDCQSQQELIFLPEPKRAAQVKTRAGHVVCYLVTNAIVLATVTNR